MYGVDFPIVRLSQAYYDLDRRSLVVSMDPGIPGGRGQPTTFRVNNVDTQRRRVTVDGQPSQDWRIGGDELEITTTVAEHTFAIGQQWGRGQSKPAVNRPLLAFHSGSGRSLAENSRPEFCVTATHCRTGQNVGAPLTGSTHGWARRRGVVQRVRSVEWAGNCRPRPTDGSPGSMTGNLSATQPV